MNILANISFNSHSEHNIRLKINRNISVSISILVPNARHAMQHAFYLYMPYDLMRILSHRLPLAVSSYWLSWQYIYISVAPTSHTYARACRNKMHVVQ